MRLIFLLRYDIMIYKKKVLAFFDKSEFSGELHDCRNRKVIREKVYKKDRAGQTAF